ICGASPDALLDTYHAERHPVAARVLRNTMAITALDRGDDRSEALRDLVSDLMQVDEARRRYFATLSGLDINYDLGSGHHLLGRRVPDLGLTSGQGPARVFALLHEARPVLLELAPAAALDVTPWASRVRHVRARAAGPWHLPALGEVPAPAAVLIRPDGHVAWASDGTNTDLPQALTRWCGPPNRPVCP